MRCVRSAGIASQVRRDFDGACFFGFPSGLTLRAPNGTEFIGIAFAKVSTHLKEEQ